MAGVLGMHQRRTKNLAADIVGFLENHGPATIHDISDALLCSPCLCNKPSAKAKELAIHRCIKTRPWILKHYVGGWNHHFIIYLKGQTPGDKK